MRTHISEIFFVVFLLFQSGFAEEPAQVTGGFQSDTSQEQEVNETKNKILTSLFFRGKVADAIIENRLYGAITKNEFSTYSELRDYLINWISRHPDEAADLYYSAQHKRDVANMPSELAYFVPFVVINPHFKELVEQLERSANDKSLTDERLRLDGARLFEGYINYGNGHLDIGGAVHNVSGAPSIYSFTNYKINPTALNTEEENIRNVYEAVKRELSSAGKELSQKKESLDQEYSKFSIFVSGLKGRKNLSEAEATGLEAMRKSMRSSFISARLLLLASDLRRYLSLPGDSLLKQDLEKFIKMLEKESSDLESGESNLAAAFNFLKQSQQIYDNFKRELLLNRRLAAVKREAENQSFSCLFDYISYKALETFYPGSAYLAAKKRVVAALPDINAFFRKSENREIQNLSLEDYKRAQAKILQAENDLAALRKTSEVNRKVQFYLWEMFWPFGVTRGEDGGKRIFLNYFDTIYRKDKR